MGQRILESRCAMPSRVVAAISSRLAASRPPISAAHPTGRAATTGDQAAKTSNGDEEDDEDSSLSGEEKEVEDLEREVREMGQRILESRRAMPSRLADAISSRLAASRPPISAAHPTGHAATTGDQAAETQVQSELNHDKSSSADADHGLLEKLGIFRAKTASNIAAMPVILKRMHDCIARIDKLDQFDVEIHSVLKRKRIC